MSGTLTLKIQCECWAFVECQLFVHWNVIMPGGILWGVHTNKRGKYQRNAVFYIKGLRGSDGLWKQWLPLQQQDWSSWNGTDKPVEGFLDVSPKVPYPCFYVMSFNWGFKVPSDLNISIVSYSLRVKPKTSIYSATFYDPHFLFPPFISVQNFFFF